MLYEQLFIEGQPPAVLALTISAAGIVNGWGTCTTGRGDCVMPTTKDGFQFAAADRIPLLLDGFEKQFLSRSGELKSLARSDLVNYLAECHVEFILIHPFREGNGRLSRLLCDVLSVLAGRAYWTTACGMSTRRFTSRQYRQAYQGTTGL